MVKRWIAGAIKRKGALHKALGVPKGRKIPAAKLARAAKAKGRLGRQARLAVKLRSFPRHHGPRKKR